MDNQTRPPVIDGHVDLIYDMMRRVPGTLFSRMKTGHVTHGSLEKGAIRVMVAALFCPDRHNGPGNAPACLESICEYARRYLDSVDIIRNRSMLDNALYGQNAPGVLFLLENGDVLAEMGAEELKTRGIVAVGLTHAGENRLGFGSDVASPGRLKTLGKMVLRTVAEAGLALDVSHLSDPCFQDVMDLFDGPVFSSHTGFRKFCDLPRNLSDEQLDLLVARGAVIGVTINPEMLRNEANVGIADVFKQLDWLIQTYGPDHAAIGSDFGGFDVACAGLEHMGKIPSLVERMFLAGYPEDVVEKVMGGNWARFYGGILEKGAHS